MYTFYTKPVYFKNQFLSYRWQIAGRTKSTAAALPAAIPILGLRVAPAHTPWEGAPISGRPLTSAPEQPGDAPGQTV